MGASKWKKARQALGLNLCVYLPKTSDDSPHNSRDVLSDSVELATLRSLNSSRQSVKGSTSVKLSCAICLGKITKGCGQAIFTAECSHSFHFRCIASNVKHGNQICPICRAEWKEVPLQASSGLDPSSCNRRAPSNALLWPQDDVLMPALPRTPLVGRDQNRRHILPLLQAPESTLFNDDEPLDLQNVVADQVSAAKNVLDVKTFMEVSAVPGSHSHENFTVLVQINAPSTTNLEISRTRTPLDLVTIIDVSGSMAGTKLALLKRAMGFVIQNLCSHDRLSVIAFSSTAIRLFPLCRMTHAGQQLALQAISSLFANGGTNIVDGLKKGVKIMEERQMKNPAANIILLSDGQHMPSTVSPPTNQLEPYHDLFWPLLNGSSAGFHIPVHTFGFGADADASSMHAISEVTCGTFSFIENEAAIQDSFAQCIGGLLSVVVQELCVEIKSEQADIHLSSVKAGNYSCRLSPSKQSAYIDVGDLYADEQKDFLVMIRVPEEPSGNETSLIKVRCVYQDPLTKESRSVGCGDAILKRLQTDGAESVRSTEVVRQQNRILVADAMKEARMAADRGDLAGAVRILDNCRRLLSENALVKSHDQLFVALDGELKMMQERMANRRVYESCGRAYVLSGLSSHLWQRPTARGDSTASSSMVQAYQTPSMAEMLTRSQTTLLSVPLSHMSGQHS